jgi:glycosyltransferase involved in cell wall biosynthesis
MPTKVTILLATYNGEAYLKAQLDSLFAQTYSHIEVIARDDGSSDNTVTLLSQYPITLIETTQNLGAKGSFGALLSYAFTRTENHYFMFCDQDDVWHTHKVASTLQKMQKIEKEGIPTLIHTDLEVVNESVEPIANSLWKFEHINPTYNSLNRLLMHNTITGCTTMVNRALVEKALPIPQESIMHDWWLGLVATQFGTIGTIYEPTMKYRQHQHNDTGAKKYTLYNIVQKAYNLLKNDPKATQHLKQKMAQAEVFLERYKEEVSQSEKSMLSAFANLHTYGFFKKRNIMLKYAILKYGLLRNIGLLLKL